MNSTEFDMCTFGLLPWWLSLQCRRLGFDPWVGKIPWRRVRLSYPLQYSGLKNSTGFPGGLEVKASACNAGDLSSIPGLGRSSGEVNGYPLQYSWASLVAQLGKNPTAMQETSVQSLGWEDPLEKGNAIHSSILAWRISWTV